MQRIAAEFGYSETSFVLPPKDAGNTAEVRIFTPVMEVPFAGHPNVGTAYVLATQGTVFAKPVGEHLRFEEKAGLVRVTVSRDAEGKVSATTIRAPAPLTVGTAIRREIMAPCVGLSPDDIRTDHHEPTFASVGLKFILIEVASLAALSGGIYDRAPDGTAGRYVDENCDCATFLYTWVGPDHIRARMFAPFDNVAEDPATGSASAALGAFLTTLDPPPAERRLLIEQGVEMGRRSLITVTVRGQDGKLQGVEISGQSIMVMSGDFHL